jgi:hypothetical protein
VTLTNGGDSRFYNNLFQQGAEGDGGHDTKGLNVTGFGTWVYDTRKFPTRAAGNVYLNGARAYSKESNPLVLKDVSVKPRLVEEGDRVFLQLSLDAALAKAVTTLVNTELLGKTVVAELGYEQSDGAPLTLDTDYFGKPRSKSGPAAGPFENPGAGEVKLRVW